MKLEEAQAEYMAMTKTIIAKQQARIKLRRKLQVANKKFHESGEATYKSWQFKYFNDELEIMKEEIDNLKEQRELLMKNAK